MNHPPGWPRQLAALGALLTLTFAAAAVGGWVTSQTVNTWYPTLEKPAWTPPAWVFGPVWTTLYLLMAIAAWLVWRQAGLRGACVALTLYAIQLVLNIGWSVVFFGLKNPGLAVLEIAVLWIAIVLTITAFWRRSPLAGLLLVPYLAWSSFAAALNFAIWRLND